MKNNQALIENFLEAKFGEEGLSENTILAYSRDLEQICKKVGKSLVDVSQSDLEKYFISVSYTHLTLPTNREV